MFVNFGFNIYGTKEISINRENSAKLEEITSSILIIKGSFFAFSFILVSIILFFLKINFKEQILYYLTLYLCLYEFMFPLWYFQGVEKMKYITYINLISRFTFVLLIFIFVLNKNDYLLVPLINGIGALLSGIISFYVLFVIEKIKFRVPKFKILLAHAKESSVFAISNIASNIKDNLSKVLIGIFLGHSEVTYFDIGEKILKLMRIPVGLTVQTIFPRINRDKDVLFITKVIKLLLIVMTILYTGIIIFSKPIVLLLGGRDLLPAINVIRTLNFLILPNTISFILMQILIPFGYKKKYVTGLILSNIFYLIFFSLIEITGNIGIIQVSLVQVSSELILLAYVYTTCIKLGIIKLPALISCFINNKKCKKKK